MSGFVWFIDKEPKVYNVHDAGNFLWGYTMRTMGFSLKESLFLAQQNEGEKDASGDQQAITEGFQSKMSTSLVKPGDIRINADQDYYDMNTGEIYEQPMLLKIALEIEGRYYDQ